MDDTKPKSEAEQALELQRLAEDLEQFAYAASHDLQEPLRAVSNYASLLAEEYGDKLGDEGGLYVSYIVDSTARMRSMIDGLLAFSRVGRHERLAEEVDTDSVLDDAIVNLETAIEESGAVITKGCHLPGVTGDAPMLTRLFQNLIANAIKFRRYDSPPQVHISAEDRGNGFWTFSVRDNGIGIDMNHAARIFVIFQRLVKDRNGTGIGLSICKKIVEHHGGNIWVESEPNNGATFYFTLKKPDVEQTPHTSGGGQPSGRADGPEGVGQDADQSKSGCSPRWSRGASIPPGNGTVLQLAETRSRPAGYEPAESEWPRSAGGTG
jgi:light-regulated signal transduction histidine kinase (bacteriophytochrome)